MHVDLHWLDVPERVKFKLMSMVHIHVLHNCLHHKSLQYLMDYYIPISDVAHQHHLRSVRRHYLVVPRQSQLVWTSGICCCQPNCLELTGR